MISKQKSTMHLFLTACMGHLDYFWNTTEIMYLNHEGNCTVTH